ncbi:MAG TPA: GAF domain-containing protein [Burkholderiaceae bacterium]|nr:GAF domain-containing protein [Burkholderiaceae bacterium]
MPDLAAPSPTGSPLDLAEMLDAVDRERDADAALERIDAWRRRIAGASVFSIQQNVTTADDLPNEIQLRRYYSSEGRDYPVNGSKRKTLTAWTERLFVHGRPFIGEGAETLAQHFDDYARMSSWNLQSVVNVPLMQGAICYATFNVFGSRSRWMPHELLGIRVLALAAARWVPVAPRLSYRLDAEPHRKEA